MAEDKRILRLPRSSEIPSIGLYLDQTVKYINRVFEPISCVEVTPSMVSNYVKKKYIEKPVKKLYDRDQIRKLIFIVLAKLVLSMDHIGILLDKGRGMPVDDKAYDEFCSKIERELDSVFGAADSAGKEDGGREDRFMDTLFSAIAYYIYINHCIDKMK